MRMEEGCAIRLRVQMSRLTSCPITLDAISRVSRTCGRRRYALPVYQFASLPDENRYNGGKQTPGPTHGASQIPRPSLPGHILRTAASHELMNKTSGRLPDCSLVSVRNQRLGWS